MKNQAPVDVWSPLHVGAGAVFGLAGVGLPLALVGAVGYELVEQLIERSELGQEAFATSGPESIVNVGADLVFFALGYGAGRLGRYALLS